MFFVKFESAKNEFSPSYYVLPETTEEEAGNRFSEVFTPFQVVRNAELFVTLYQAGEAMGQEIFVDGASVRITGPLPWNYEEMSYRHPQDYTVYHVVLPEGMLQELKTLLVWEQVSFPNGSNYQQQKLPTGTFTLPSFGEVTVEYGYRVRHGWDVYKLSSATISVGPGVNLGAHFNSRDKVLSAFQ